MKTQSTFRPGSHTTNLNFLVRVAAFVAVAALIFIPVFSSSSATSADKSARVNTPDSLAPQATGAAVIQEAAPVFAATMFPLVMPQATPVEEVATFQSDCTTPDSTFELGQTICAKITGAPVGGRIRRRIAIVNTAGLIVAKANVTTDPQTLSFTLPTEAISNDNGTIVDNRGTWRVNDINTENGSVKTSVKFEVTDPAQPVANLTITKNGPDTVAAGSGLTYTLLVSNGGPNAATNVQFTDDVPANTTFVSFTQDGGFTCTNPAGGATGTTTCSVASLANGEFAKFTFTYNVDIGVAPESTITNTATITSSTFESHPTDNTSVAPVRVLAATGTGVTCTIDCPANIVVTANTTQGGNPGALVTYGAASGFGDCGAISNSPASGSFFTVGTHTVTSTAEAGPSCSFTVKVVDTPAPTISCPSDKTATAGPDGTATVNPGTPTFTASGGGTIHGIRSDSTPPVYDDDGNLLSPGNEIPLTDPYPTGITGITWTVTDADGRTATCRQRIIVNAVCTVDTATPTITAPAAITVSTGADNPGCSVALNDELGDATATDDCSVTITVSGIPAGNNFPIGTTTLTYTATDQAGHSASATQTVTVIDDTPPHISAPANASYVCPSDVPAASPSQAGGTDPNLPNGGPPTDNCGAPTVTVSESSSGAGSAASPKIIVRTFTATDSHGNSASAVQTITVIDSIAPTIALTGANPQYVECHTSYPELGAVASDNCSANFAATPSGTVGVNTPGSYTITYNASDAAGNAATPVTRTVIVQDTIKPVITRNGPATVTVECHTSYTDAGATASDACDTSVPVTTSGSVDVNTVGSYTLTYNAADDSGNAAIAVTRTVNVVDTTPPVITLNSYAPSMWPPNHKYSTFQLTQFVTGATDSCNTSLGLSAVVIEKVTSDEIENGNGDGNTTNDIVIATGCKSVQLRSEREGDGNGRVYTITFKVTDASGNIGRATAKVVVPHNPGETVIDSGVHYTVTCP